MTALIYLAMTSLLVIADCPFPISGLKAASINRQLEIENRKSSSLRPPCPLPELKAAADSSWLSDSIQPDK